MAKLYGTCLISILILFAIPTSCLSYLPPKTPVLEALKQGKHAFIGRLISVKYINEKKGIERAEGVFEVLLPIYGAVPKKNKKTKIIYYTTYEVDPCLDFEKIPVGTVSLFIFKGDQNWAPERYNLSYCWPRIDLSYEITSSERGLRSEEGTLDMKLISGWWAGKITVKKLHRYIKNKKD